MSAEQKTSDIHKNNQRLNYKIAIIYILLVMLFIAIVVLL